MKLGMLVFLVLIVEKSFPKVLNVDVKKIEFCSRLKCRKEDVGLAACGLRAEGNGFRLKLFENECELLKYGCSVDEAKAYGIINTEYCDRSFGTSYNESVDYMKNYNQKLKSDVDYIEINDQKLDNNVVYMNNDSRRFNNALFINKTGKCDIACENNEKKEVCGIREDGKGFRIRLFQNYCELTKHNCENDLEFIRTDLFICKTDLNNTEEENIQNNYVLPKNAVNENTFQHNKELVDDLENSYTKDYKDELYKVNKTDVKNLVVVNSKIFGQYDNISDSIDTFFAASHVFDLPLKEVQLNTRRKMLKYAGPIKVFVPWIAKPKIIGNDTFHRPTLSSCYHKCPFKCPDTYAPVCGVPGVVAREPSLMFQNHCFMDVAQCKMFWENKSSTSHSSYYVESSFLFCMGDEMNAVYRFLPAIRTLQHMGRLKKKGKFRAVLRNFRFVSEFRYGRPKFMGRK
ncbi:uncharacterized protein [Maniola hyperantus]|uniref:uncharacterized protein n=1 Tax=Aphantopus hyperantus TaxID=2795564 RepID=UPI001568B80A|nr:uncharacterized protein LOC117988799 isoform X2 [Maniola hyperantus]